MVKELKGYNRVRDSGSKKNEMDPTEEGGSAGSSRTYGARSMDNNRAQQPPLEMESLR